MSVILTPPSAESGRAIQRQPSSCRDETPLPRVADRSVLQVQNVSLDHFSFQAPTLIRTLDLVSDDFFGTTSPSSGAENAPVTTASKAKKRLNFEEKPAPKRKKKVETAATDVAARAPSLLTRQVKDLSKTDESSAVSRGSSPTNEEISERIQALGFRSQSADLTGLEKRFQRLKIARPVAIRPSSAGPSLLVPPNSPDKVNSDVSFFAPIKR